MPSIVRAKQRRVGENRAQSTFQNDCQHALGFTFGQSPLLRQSAAPRVAREQHLQIADGGFLSIAAACITRELRPPLRAHADDVT